ncbi:hypothetical protein J2X04_000956 [Lysobacter niabensis]|uniref:Uncharacterized protein n=1 Tax=Agrilutibacter niabensis TaxID=380628 RepID=A0ABU1VM99_9GAMM|nr:hypothetical protein [Lysobacter niabensis]MDR7098609.1 hypothetical protein [Lysobacter niabensis]
MKRPTNPWMIIGWIILALIALPLVTCVAIFGGASIMAGADRTQPTQSNTQNVQTASRIASVEQLYSGYLAARDVGHQATADNYAELIRQHYPNSAQRTLIDGKQP